jgi:MFS family permease
LLDQWSNARVIVPLVLTFVFAVVFILVELYVASKPVMDPSLLKQKVPMLVSISNFLVGNCNFTVTYFFPLWFQTVMLTSASIAGLHIMPNSFSMSLGSVFAGWMIHRTGRYKNLNMILGILPFIGTQMILFMNEDSGWLQKWFSIIPLGFGNAVVFQTTLIALLAHVDGSQIAVATGFGQLFRGIGQVAGVAVSSAIFQSILDRELARKITVPGAAELIVKIRQNARLVVDLPPDVQRLAIECYKTSLTAVFIYASVSTALSYLVRLPIPEHSLETRPQRRLSETTRISPNDGMINATAREDRESGLATPEMESGAATPGHND